jgi:alpha-tubulin suppressor-like RCC1 family protein
MAARTIEGDVYTWGHNVSGQCGLGHTNDVLVPTKVDDPPPRRPPDLVARPATDVVDVEAGIFHNLALCWSTAFFESQ